MTKERSIEAATIGLHKLINAISQSHIEEIKAIEENQKEREKAESEGTQHDAEIKRRNHGSSQQRIKPGK